MRTWPEATIATSSSSTTSRWPTIALAISSRRRCRISAAWLKGVLVVLMRGSLRRNRRGEAVPVGPLQRAHGDAQRHGVLAGDSRDRLGAFARGEEARVAGDRAARFFFERANARPMQGRAGARGDEGSRAPHLLADRSTRPRRIGEERAEA